MKPNPGNWLAGLMFCIPSFNLSLLAQQAIPLSAAPSVSASGETEIKIDRALELFAELSGRTVLRSGSLPDLPLLTASQLPQDPGAKKKFIEGALAKEGFEIIPKGKLFVLVVPSGWNASPAAA